MGYYYYYYYYHLDNLAWIGVSRSKNPGRVLIEHRRMVPLMEHGEVYYQEYVQLFRLETRFKKVKVGLLMHFPFADMDSLRKDCPNQYIFLESVGFTVVNSRSNPFNLINNQVLLPPPSEKEPKDSNESKQLRRKQAQRKYYLRHRKVVVVLLPAQNQVDQPREAGFGGDTTT